MRFNGKNILRVAILIIICLIVGEVFLIFFAPIYFAGYIGAYKYDDKLGMRLKDNIHFFKTTDHQQEVRTNQFGTVNFQESFKEFDQLIYTIGDSYTQGTGLSSDASYPFQLDLLLNMQSHKYEYKFGVINLGLAAFGLKQSILALEEYVDIIGAPAYVIYFGTDGDTYDDMLFDTGYRHAHLTDGNPKWGVLGKPLQWVTQELEIGKRFKMVLGRIRRNIAENKSARSDMSKSIEEENNSIETNKLNIESEKLIPQLEYLRNIVDKLGGKLIVSWSSHPNGKKDSYNWIKKWAGVNDVLFADWHPRVLSVAEAIPAIPFANNHSGGHWRTWINTEIALSFYELIVTYDDKPL